MKDKSSYSSKNKAQIILPQEKKLIIPDTQFKTVEIGNQIWMAENLNVDRFRNGDPIPEAGRDEWRRAGENKQPAWCYYDNDPANGDYYGKLYNWYAVNDKRGIAPEGWHVPSKKEFDTLLSHVGGSANNAFHALKEGGSSGFAALFGGWRYQFGGLDDIGVSGLWWSSSRFRFDVAWCLCISNFNQDAGVIFYFKEYGFSVRCIQDLPR